MAVVGQHVQRVETADDIPQQGMTNPALLVAATTLMVPKGVSTEVFETKIPPPALVKMTMYWLLGVEIRSGLPSPFTSPVTTYTEPLDSRLVEASVNTPLRLV